MHGLLNLGSSTGKSQYSIFILGLILLLIKDSLAFFSPSPTKLKRCDVFAVSTFIFSKPSIKCDAFPSQPEIIIGTFCVEGISSNVSISYPCPVPSWSIECKRISPIQS